MLTYKIIFVSAFVLLIGLISACQVDVPTPPVSSEDQIQSYLTANNLTTVAQSTSSGLYYIIDNAGVGPNPTASNTVMVHYRGYLADGTEFDSSYKRGEPSKFGLTSVIGGWTEGIPLFKKGGSGKLIVPFELGYGSRGNNDIPPNTIIIFDIELFDFE